VVLVYKTEEYLRECFDSLVNQTLKDIEIIIVNDSSPDNSHIIIEEYRQKYGNIKVINQKNSGGAVAGNNGLQHASGEYVTIMDSDDVVPIDAYEKLYNKAIQTKSDIVIGKPHLLVGGVQREIRYKFEKMVWDKEREITNLDQFLDIFYDGYYWNKIYRKDFLFQYDCFMPPGMLYADRPMVHKAYLYAKKIAIITDVVYLWRKREENAANKSITQMKFDIKNFQDRMESLDYQLAYFKKFNDENLINEFMKRNLDRLFFPIKGVLEDQEFREIYLTEVKEILSNIDDVFENDIGITKNLYIYMILNDLRDELIYYLSNTPNGEIIEEDGRYYWALPYFRDDAVRIPDKLFEIKVLLDSFIKIGSVSNQQGKVTFSSITVPEVFEVQNGWIEFRPKYQNDQKLWYNLDCKPGNDIKGEIDISNIVDMDVYDVFISFSYNTNKEDTFRISKRMLQNEAEIEEGGLYFTKKGYLSFENIEFKVKGITFEEEKLKLELNEDPEFPFEFYLRDRLNKKKIFFKQLSRTKYELKWEHFLESYSFYDLYYTVHQTNNYRLTVNKLLSFDQPKMSIGSTYVEMYKTNYGNISLKTYTFISKIVNKLKAVAGKR
jgi:glycosyltransferase involved in cell wall biosynthesis